MRHVILDAVLLGAVVGTVERLERAAEDGRVSALDVLAALKSPVLTALRMRYSELEDDLIALMDGVVAGNRAVFEEPEAGEENAGIMELADGFGFGNTDAPDPAEIVRFVVRALMRNGGALFPGNLYDEIPDTVYAAILNMMTNVSDLTVVFDDVFALDSTGRLALNPRLGLAEAASTGAAAVEEEEEDELHAQLQLAQHLPADVYDSVASGSAAGDAEGGGGWRKGRPRIEGMVAKIAGIKFYFRDSTMPESAPQSAMYFCRASYEHFPEAKSARVGMRCSFTLTSMKPNPNPIVTAIKLEDDPRLFKAAGASSASGAAAAKPAAPALSIPVPPAPKGAWGVGTNNPVTGKPITEAAAAAAAASHAAAAAAAAAAGPSTPTGVPRGRLFSAGSAPAAAPAGSGTPLKNSELPDGVLTGIIAAVIDQRRGVTSLPGPSVLLKVPRDVASAMRDRWKKPLIGLVTDHSKLFKLHDNTLTALRRGAQSSAGTVVTENELLHYVVFALALAMPAALRPAGADPFTGVLPPPVLAAAQARGGGSVEGFCRLHPTLFPPGAPAGQVELNPRLWVFESPRGASKVLQSPSAGLAALAPEAQGLAEPQPQPQPQPKLALPGDASLREGLVVLVDLYHVYAGARMRSAQNPASSAVHVNLDALLDNIASAAGGAIGGARPVAFARGFGPTPTLACEVLSKNVVLDLEGDRGAECKVVRAMATNLGALAYHAALHPAVPIQRTFCVVAGSASYVDVIRHALAQGVQVELWAFSQARAPELLQLMLHAPYNHLLRLVDLDHTFDRFGRSWSLLA